jgi:hypothetical protein
MALAKTGLRHNHAAPDAGQQSPLCRCENFLHLEHRNARDAKTDQIVGERVLKRVLPPCQFF